MKTKMTGALAILALVLAAGCTTPSSGGSEENSASARQGFLEPCQASEECIEGLSCDTGVCTRTCEDDAACVDGEVQGVCGEPASSGSEGMCRVDACADPIDSEGDAAPCEPGTRWEIVTDARGCSYGECVPIEGCGDPAGDPAPVVCGEGEHLEQGTDANGCVTQTCEPDRTDCPPIAAPDASFCASGERVEAVTGEDGCPSWSCTSEGCLPVDPAPEVCFNGQPPRRQLDASGCAVDFCDPERSFPCGPGPACSIDTEYCARSLSDVVGEDDHYACQTFPEQCLGVASCECLLDALQIDPAEQVMCEDGGGPGAASSITLTFPGG